MKALYKDILKVIYKLCKGNCMRINNEESGEFNIEVEVKQECVKPIGIYSRFRWCYKELSKNMKRVNLGSKDLRKCNGNYYWWF